MQVRVLYFAAARERAGLAEEALDVGPGTTVADLRRHLGTRHPALAGLLPACRMAVDLTIAREDTVLAPGAEVAVLPPVAGG